MRNVTTPTDTTDTVQVWTEQARETWQKMVFRVQHLGRHYGEDSKQYAKAAGSLAQISASLIGWGSMRVSRDGDMSLFCDTGSFVFGLIWFPDKRHCTNDGCAALIADDGTASAYPSDRPMCGSHVPSYPLDAPHPGTWSSHS